MNDDDRLLFEKNFKSALNGISLSFTSPATRFIPWSTLKQSCREGARRTRIAAKSVVNMRQKEVDVGTVNRDDALSYVLKLKTALPNCDIEDLVDMVVTFVFGGNRIFFLGIFLAF